MVAEVEVCTRVDTLNLLEAKRHKELDVGSGVGVVSQFLMVVVAILLIAEAKSLVPFQAGLLPFLEPFKLIAWTHEELHFHLLELTHTEDELTRNDFVTESLANLCDTKRNAHTSCFLNVKEVHEDALSRFRTQIDAHRTVGSASHLCREHQVELTHLSPVLCA